MRKECEMKEGERRRREREWEGQTEEGEQGLRRATGEQGITVRHRREEVMIKKGNCDAFLTSLLLISTFNCQATSYEPCVEQFNAAQD